MAISYAPIVDNEIVPAFYDEGLKIRFKHNPAVDPNMVIGFKVIIKDFITGDIMRTAARAYYDEIKTAIETGEIHMGSDETFSLRKSNGEKALTKGNFYKFQLCYLYDKNGHPAGWTGGEYVYQESPYSYTTLGRYLGSKGNEIYVTISRSSRKFTGSILGNNGVLGERIYQYKFELLEQNRIVETTGWKLYDFVKGASENYASNGSPIYTTYYDFKAGVNYKMKYSIITHNGYECYVNTTNFNMAGLSTPAGLQITVQQNTSQALENGYVEIKVVNPASLKNCQIVRKLEQDTIWEKIYVFSSNTNNKTQTIKDNTVEQGVKYQYALLDSAKNLVSPNNTAISIAPDFEHIYLSDKKCQLCIRFDPKVSNFKTTLLEQKIDTLGGKYPLFMRNGMVNYKEIGISGLISYHMDNDNLFFNKTNWIEQYEDYGSTNLTKNNFYLERQFRNKVVEWLTNGEPKLYRSPTEGNMIIRLMNVSITPNDQLGRMTYNFSATGYEVDDIIGKVDQYVLE